ncbi:MAG: alpha/beta hydrolase [Burkholderiales bacterium]
MRVSDPLSIVALHGVADSAEQIDQMAALVPARVLSESSDVRWVFPRASERAVSIFGGRVAHAWYDILAFDRSRMDDSGIAEACDIVSDVVRAEREGGPGGRRVVLVGFSQGGALALHAGLALGDAVAGIFALAAALPYPDLVSTAGPRAPRVFLGHGRFDRRVAHALGLESYRLLVARGYDVAWRSYWCGHVVAPRAMRDLRAWLRTGGPAESALEPRERVPQGRLATA